jgi:hypothetical protein
MTVSITGTGNRLAAHELLTAHTPAATLTLAEHLQHRGLNDLSLGAGAGAGATRWRGEELIDLLVEGLGTLEHHHVTRVLQEHGLRRWRDAIGPPIECPMKTTRSSPTSLASVAAVSANRSSVMGPAGILSRSWALQSIVSPAGFAERP